MSHRLEENISKAHIYNMYRYVKISQIRKHLIFKKQAKYLNRPLPPKEVILMAEKDMKKYSIALVIT